MSDSLWIERFIIYFIIGSLLVSGCSEGKIDFTTEIRPIFNEHCVSCHGGVKQSGGFGLVFRENALRETENGKLGIVPGNAQKSELYKRIISHDPDVRMPFEEDPLNSQDIAKIKEWIDQGAEWGTHWAYLLPDQPNPPSINSSWIKNDIDLFVLDKVQANGLQPSPRADRNSLLRRVYLDIVGLPPTSDQVQSFMQNRSPDAYSELVDELLALEQFGEHWASFWLDLARYADSFGYSSDVDRIIWQYRDWVIKAFNRDMPFDQFTIEQIAGDLLPNPSVDQLIATAFHRACLTNGEGGANHEENRNMAVIDRVNTTWEAWQGTTMGCVQCHNHPYDPIKQTDFYQGFAFFNNTNDHNLREDYPLLRSFDIADEARLEEIKSWISNYGTQEEVRAAELFLRTHEPKLVPFDFGESQHTKFYNRTGDDYMSAYDGSTIHLGHFNLKGIDKLFLNYSLRNEGEGKINIHLTDPSQPIVGSADLVKTSRGFEIMPIPLKTVVEEAEVYVSIASGQIDFEIFIEGFMFGTRLPGEEQANHASICEDFESLMNANPAITTPIMVEKPAGLKRTTQVFHRGNWLTKGETVEPGVADAFLTRNHKEFTDRLDLAKWLVSENNPLTARVMVNRIWANLFGKGIVQTLEDFGSMGDPPTHPELLDWLAQHFARDLNWQFKKLIKNIVLSATYQQSSKVHADALEKDPDNLWLSRSPRTRLTAEQIRDQALQVSGLLSEKMYGPGVKPIQPDGIWKVSFSNAKWITSEGEDRYRRAIYTFLKRTALYPSFLTFDASGREVCLSRRIPTNTPLQALVTLNDPVYFEAAKSLARMIKSHHGNREEKLVKAYFMIMGKLPSPAKKKVLTELYEEIDQYYRRHKEEALEVAQSNDTELAVLTIVSNSLMNMDEFIMKS